MSRSSRWRAGSRPGGRRWSPARPGVFAHLRSFAPNVLRANGVTNVSEAVYVNALSLDRLLAYGLAKSQN